MTYVHAPHPFRNPNRVHQGDGDRHGPAGEIARGAAPQLPPLESLFPLCMFDAKGSLVYQNRASKLHYQEIRLGGQVG